MTAAIDGGYTLFLQRILDEEEAQMLILEIREELMEDVMTALEIKYMETQGIKLMVHCTLKALKQALEIYFYHHNDVYPFVLKHPAWSADDPGLPSKSDTWAAYRVPVFKTAEEKSLKSEGANKKDRRKTGTKEFAEMSGDYSVLSLADYYQGRDDILSTDGRPTDELLAMEKLSQEQDHSGTSAQAHEEELYLDMVEVTDLDEKEESATFLEQSFEEIVASDTVEEQPKSIFSKTVLGEDLVSASPSRVYPMKPIKSRVDSGSEYRPRIVTLEPKKRQVQDFLPSLRSHSKLFVESLTKLKTKDAKLKPTRSPRK